MTLTEVIEGLQVVREYCRVRPFAVDAAITHLDPYTQAITPERLGAAGFRLDTYNIWRRTVESKDRRFHLSWKVRSGVERFYVLIGATAFALPGVRSMGHVLSLVEMLEGGDGA